MRVPNHCDMQYTNPRGNCVSDSPTNMRGKTGTNMYKKGLKLGRIVLFMRPSHHVKVTRKSEQAHNDL